jgi:hypothetical protein
MFDLTGHLKAQERRVASLAIRIAVKEIARCGNTDKKWQAMQMLRPLQAIARQLS